MNPKSEEKKVLIALKQQLQKPGPYEGKAFTASELDP